MDDELITERRSVAFPQVFGYLRHVTGGLARHAALVGCLTEYCRQHELTLCGVFTEREQRWPSVPPPSSASWTRSNCRIPMAPWFPPSAISARSALPANGSGR
ncbi:hypothetical protein [Streptomyces mirabilis]|uniref:hypothetical protein n=1 Tax=Streptomyces mirabilis TaxID=68239 RepID=UPI0036D9C482